MIQTRDHKNLATLKEKGQITLPANIRKALQADTGDIFDFEVRGESVVMTRQRLVGAQAVGAKRRSKGLDISKYIGSMKGTFGRVEDIDTYISEERRGWN